MKIQSRLAEVCRSYVGVPFRERSRDPKVGLDCAGVVGAALKELEIPFEDEPRYSLDFGTDNYATLCMRLASVFECVSREPLAPAELTSLESRRGGNAEWQPGDVVAYRHRLCNGHLVVYIGHIAGVPFLVESVRGRNVQMKPIETDWASRITKLGGEFSVWRLTQV